VTTQLLFLRVEALPNERRKAAHLLYWAIRSSKSGRSLAVNLHAIYRVALASFVFWTPAILLTGFASAAGAAMGAKFYGKKKNASKAFAIGWAAPAFRTKASGKCELCILAPCPSRASHVESG